MLSWRLELLREPVLYIHLLSIRKPYSISRTVQRRSNFAPLMMAAWDVRKEGLDYASIRKLVAEWRQAAPHLLGDFYPLANYSAASDVWMAFQFDSRDGAEGIVQAFRRAKCPSDSIRVKLRGLDPKAVYVLANADVAGATEATGRELGETGLLIAIKSQPGAAVVAYKKKP
jgi:hypothetical protein